MTSTLPKNRAPRALALAVIAAAAVVAACEAAATEPVSAPRRAGTAEFVTQAAENGDGMKVTVRRADGGAPSTFTFREGESLPRKSEGPAPLFYIDGQLSTEEAMRAIPVDRIERVEVTKGEAALAINPQAAGGIIQITLKKS